MSEEVRGNLLLGLWFLSTLVVVAVFISSAAIGELTLAHILFAFTILVLAVTGTTYLLRAKDSETEQAKAKRRRIDNVLRDMSDEELIELKQRLSDSDYSVETMMKAVGDDGELVRRK